MASQITICNEALDMLPAGRIQSIDAATPEAKACKSQYPLAKRTVLARRSWSFLLTRVALAPTTAAAVVQQAWAYAYHRPNNLSIVSVVPGSSQTATGQYLSDRWRDGAPFELVGELLLTNLPAAAVLARISADDCPETRIDNLTATAIAVELAKRICLPITKSNTRYRELNGEAAVAFETAARADQAQTPDQYGDFVPDALMARHA